MPDGEQLQILTWATQRKLLSAEMGDARCEAGFGGKSRSSSGIIEFEVSVRHPSGGSK